MRTTFTYFCFFMIAFMAIACKDIKKKECPDGYEYCKICKGYGQDDDGNRCIYCRGGGILKSVWTSEVDSPENSNNSTIQKNISQPIQQQAEPPVAEPRKIPVQEFQKCNICGGSGICNQCGGQGGFEFFNGRSMSYNQCVSCAGFARCSFCGGRGGEYVVRYIDAER